MKSNLTTKAFTKVFALAALTAPLLASAQNFTPSTGTTVGGMARNGADAMSGIYSLLMNGALVCGVFLALLGLWLLYQNKKDEGRTKASHGVVALVIGALMIFLPSVIEGMAGTVFGSGPAKQAPSTMR